MCGSSFSWKVKKIQLINILLILEPRLTSIPSPAIEIKRRRQVPERKGANAKGHVESSVHQSESLESTLFRFCALSSWPRRYFSPGILLIRTAPAVQRNHFILANRCLAHGTQLSAWTCLQPLVQARPAEQVATHAHHGILGRV